MMTDPMQQVSRGPDPAIEQEVHRPNGPPMAAVVAAGVGCFVLGLFTTLAEASAAVKDWLTFSDPVGPLSGKVSMAVFAWALSWIGFGVSWRRRDIDLRTVLIVTAILIGIGALGTFPSFFEQFAS